jgi:hypothetical protein
MRRELYGLVIETDIDLRGAGLPTERDPDVRVTAADFVGQDDVDLNGHTLLDFQAGEERYTLVRVGDGGFLFRLHGFGDVRVSPSVDEVSVALAPHAPEGMTGVITIGAVLSLLLYLRHLPVFHGSAVDIGGEAVAFIGHSGQGKTTMAALFCAEGATAITDDVLVIENPDGVPAVRRGSRELRLRRPSSSLAAVVSGGTTRISADDRIVVAAPGTLGESVPLAAVVIPAPTRDGSPLRFMRLKATDATFALIGFPRLLGWRDPRILADLMAAAAAIASRVPVFVAYTPWGPPFPDGMTRALLGELR